MRKESWINRLLAYWLNACKVSKNVWWYRKSQHSPYKILRLLLRQYRQWIFSDQVFKVDKTYLYKLNWFLRLKQQKFVNKNVLVSKFLILSEKRSYIIVTHAWGFPGRKKTCRKLFTIIIILNNSITNEYYNHCAKLAKKTQ